MRVDHQQMRMLLRRSIRDVNCRERFDSLHLSYSCLAVEIVVQHGHCSLTDDGQVASDAFRMMLPVVRLCSNFGGRVMASLVAVELDVSFALERDHAVMKPWSMYRMK